MRNSLEILQQNANSLQALDSIKHFVENLDPKFRPGQTLSELYFLGLCVHMTKDLGHDIAEIGSYTGGSARVIEVWKNPDQKLYLIDTFEGLKDCEGKDGNQIWNGYANTESDLAITFEDVKSSFEGQNVEVIKGFFPKDAPSSFENKKFSFVHLDVDTYASTLACLKYFYPKMADEGIIVSHDYVNNHAPGVKKAVDEFVLSSGSRMLAMNGDSTQAAIFKN